MRKVLIITALLGSFGGAKALELKTDFLGKLNIAGALTLYGIHTSNKVNTDKKTRYDVGSAIINISKPAEPFGFTFIGGAYATPVVGVGIVKTSDYTDLFSALPIAYLEFAPVKG
ncbi:MAG: porin, partial [Aquificaceae bacterium]|nr:porin [Aquificaceae bacterium]